MNAWIRAGIVVVLVISIGLVLALKEKAPSEGGRGEQLAAGASSQAALTPQAPAGAGALEKVAAAQGKELPRLVDLGAGKCIPCKMMAPLLEKLKEDFAGTLKVDFIDVWKDPSAGKKYGIKLIPTQIFFDPRGKELFRHEGFFSREDILAKWKELGFRLEVKPPAFSRLTPAAPDTRPAEKVCYMCDGDIDARTRVTFQSDAGAVHLCSPHCWFITYTSLDDRTGVGGKVQVTDWTSGKQIPALGAVYLYGVSEDSSRPVVKAFGSRDAALQERARAGGNILDWKQLEARELSMRCGFCDRAVYAEDASAVKVGGVYTWGCCPMCALGVAARLQRDIEARVKDALTGEEIVVKTLNGGIQSLEPATAVAWAGLRKNAEGKVVSAGCFKQAFFTSDANLRKWVAEHPLATGKEITIGAALAKKMKLTPQQISRACKIGECKPR